MSHEIYQVMSHGTLLNAFLELHDQMMENQEDFSLFNLVGEETQSKFTAVREELLRRLPAEVGDRNPYERVRIHDVMKNESSFQTTCLSCHKKIELWWNGGELDTAQCCGYTYELEHGPLDFVVTRD